MKQTGINGKIFHALNWEDKYVNFTFNNIPISYIQWIIFPNSEWF